MSSKRVPVTVFRDGQKKIIGEADVFSDGTLEIKLNNSLEANLIEQIMDVGLGFHARGSYEKHPS